MPGGRSQPESPAQLFEPLPESPQLGTRVYLALLNSILSGRLEPGAPLRPDAIARQLEVSTTPVREAMQRLEADGVAIKMPYQGWFVREYTAEQVHELYELRAALECFSVRLACERITDAEVAWLDQHQAKGQAALAAGDMDAYRIYNRDLHDAIMRAGKNSYLSAMTGQLRLHSEILMTRTIRLSGRPVRAIEEHHRIIRLIAARNAAEAEQLMERHILSAYEDMVRWMETGQSGT